MFSRIINRSSERAGSGISSSTWREKWRRFRSALDRTDGEELHPEMPVANIYSVHIDEMHLGEGGGSTGITRSRVDEAGWGRIRPFESQRRWVVFESPPLVFKGWLRPLFAVFVRVCTVISIIYNKFLQALRGSSSFFPASERGAGRTCTTAQSSSPQNAGRPLLRRRSLGTLPDKANTSTRPRQVSEFWRRPCRLKRRDGDL